MRRALVLIVLISVGCVALVQAQTYVPDEEFVGPFSTWKNVKTDYGAVGNGIANDTAAFQAALDALGLVGNATVLYVPAGTYKITATLTMEARLGVGIIGADPATTTLLWAGTAGGNLLELNGVAYSRIMRMTLDGASSAGFLVYQAYDGSGNYFDSGNAYEDMVFQDATEGINGGGRGYGFSEVTILRSQFRRLTKGIHLNNFNALNVWVWFSVFDQCGYGITNSPGAGNYSVYHSFFTGSTSADLYAAQGGGYAVRDSTSLNSQLFLFWGASLNPMRSILQGNTILDPVDSRPIYFSSYGPAVMLDTVIRSRVGATAPVVYSDRDLMDMMTLDNTFTVASPISVAVGGRKAEYGTSIVSRASLASLGAPTLPGTAPNRNRTVYEVTPGMTTAQIQAQIDAASAFSQGTQRPVVHIQGHTAAYSITTTLVIPAGSDIQLVGDSANGNGKSSLFAWAGTGRGPVLLMRGPSHATLRDLGFIGQYNVDGIRIENADQVGSNIHCQQCTFSYNVTHNVYINGLDHTRVELRDFSHTQASAGVGLEVRGGPLAKAGTPAAGFTFLTSGTTGNMMWDWTVTDGGNLLVRDNWAEQGGAPYATLTGKGTLTIENAQIAKPINTVAPAVQIAGGFAGRFNFLTAHLWDRIVLTGDGSAATIAVMGIIGGYPDTDQVPATWLNSFSPPALDARYLFSKQITVAENFSVTPHIGAVDETFLRNAWAVSKPAESAPLETKAAGVTDVRLFRVMEQTMLTGLEITARPRATLSAVPSATTQVTITGASGPPMSWTVVP